MSDSRAPDAPVVSAEKAFVDPAVVSVTANNAAKKAPVAIANGTNWKKHSRKHSDSGSSNSSSANASVVGGFTPATPPLKCLEGLDFSPRLPLSKGGKLRYDPEGDYYPPGDMQRYGPHYAKSKWHNPGVYRAQYGESALCSSQDSSYASDTDEMPVSTTRQSTPYMGYAESAGTQSTVKKPSITEQYPIVAHRYNDTVHFDSTPGHPINNLGNCPNFGTPTVGAPYLGTPDMGYYAPTGFPATGYYPNSVPHSLTYDVPGGGVADSIPMGAFIPHAVFPNHDETNSSRCLASPGIIHPIRQPVGPPSTHW